jgi:hypothetical protein
MKEKRIHASLHRFSYRMFSGTKNSSPTFVWHTSARMQVSPVGEGTNRVLAVATSFGVAWVVEIPTERLHEVARPIQARLTEGWIKGGEFVTFALYD